MPRPGSGRAESPESGFVRAELAVVFVCVALLALVSLPSLGRVQGRSEHAGCVSNQRQLIQAFLMYAAENQDALPGTRWTGPQGAVDLASGGFWPGPVQPINSGMAPAAALTSVRDGLARGPLWAYAPDATVYHCPADRRWTALRPGSGWGWDSYSKTDGMGTGVSAGVVTYQRLGEVRAPGMSAVFVEETDPRGSNLGAWALGVQPPSWTDVPAAMHDDGAVFGFVDGHTEARRWTESTTLRAARSAMEGRQSFSFAGASANNPDFVWVWNRYRHAGWRTLP